MLSALSLCVLALQPLAPSGASAETRGASSLAAASDHGKVAWYSGGFEQALAEAKAKNKVVFIDFWTEW